MELQIQNNKAVQAISSVEVAQMVEKDHSKLLRDIRQYCEYLAEAKIGLGEFFAESTYKDNNNQERPCYLITKKGCDMVANKLTGKKGTIFTAKYVTRFEELEKQTPKSPMQLLDMHYKALGEVNDKVIGVSGRVAEVNEDLQDFKVTIPLFPVECDDLQLAVRKLGVGLLGGKKSNAYQDRSLRGRLYADIGHEIKHKFGVHIYKAIQRKHLERAKEIIEKYECPQVLLDEISQSNGGTEA